MLKKISTLTLGALGLVTLASACSVEMGEVSEEEIGSSEEAAVYCSNDQATWSIMASMAEAIADEMGRWQPRKDFKWNWSANNGGGALEFNTTGNAPANGLYPGTGLNHCVKNGCALVKKLLALQSDACSNMQFGGAEFRPENLRNRLYSYWNRQAVCLDRPDNGMGDNCPAEQHKLTDKSYTSSATTCAGGTDILFKGKYESTGAPLAAADAAQLKNMLIFLGGSDNSFLQFQGNGDTVKIDPIVGTTGDNGSSSGSCEVGTNPFWKTNVTPNAWVCDASNAAKTVGSCCTCGTVDANTPARSWQPKPFSGGWFVCK